MGAIFISYRRDDSEGQAGRLYDDLVEQFGDNAVFMDVAGIEPGRDFRRVIDDRVASCAVLLAVIGRSWADATDDQGRRRLEDPGDFVRLETVSAMRRDIPVIPVLVHGARMPRAEDLPADLSELAYRNSVELTHARWASDMGVLVHALRQYVLPPASTSAPASEPPAAAPAPVRAAAQPVMSHAGGAPTGASPASARIRPASMAMGAVIAVALVGAGLYTFRDKPAAEDDQALGGDSGTLKAAPVPPTPSPSQTETAPPSTTTSGNAAATTDTSNAPYGGVRNWRALRWRMGNFPPPNAGKVLFTVTPEGDPACMSYDALNCLWGVTYSEIDFNKVKPLVCGDSYKATYGTTGYNDPKHWCSLVRSRQAGTGNS